jgi:hypothetical protein
MSPGGVTHDFRIGFIGKFNAVAAVSRGNNLRYISFAKPRLSQNVIINFLAGKFRVVSGKNNLRNKEFTVLKNCRLRRNGTYINTAVIILYFHSTFKLSENIQIY